MKNFLKKHKKIICLVLVSFTLITLVGANNLQAAITKNPNDAIANVEEALGQASGGIATVLSQASALFMAPLTGLITMVAGVLYLAMFAIFTSLGINNTLGVPLVDDIVFNKVAFFDPNFINPDNNAFSPAKILKDTMSSLYSSFFVLAGTVFIIAALIIGIKLAITSIASQKAQYKQAIMNWLIGLLMLFSVHFIIAGAFYINEQICATAASGVGRNGI